MSLGKFMKLSLNAVKSNLMSLDRPYKLTFSISYWCNSRCLTCNIWQIRPKNELTLEEIRRFAKENNYFKWIEITGGEPFMRSDIVDIVQAFKENSKDLYIVTIPTNSLTNHDMVLKKIEEMLSTGLPRLSITVSLDGNRETHDKIRGVPGNYDRCMDMWRRLGELKKRYSNLFFVFGYTISRYNQGMFEQMFNDIKKDIPDLTYNDFHINIGQISDSYYNNSNLDIKGERETIANDIKHVVDRRRFELGAIPIIETAYLKKLHSYAKTGEMPMKSRGLDASLFMDSYGNVYPSIMWDRKIGNIRDSNYGLGQMWHNSDAEEVRKLIKEGKEPASWTACEAYQTLAGNVASLL
jgi:MoaA/NifB/PqqE/SkfB family radical SAM enzyme